METFSFLLLILFWVGVFVAAYKPKDDLRTRIEAYYYLVQNKTRSTKIAKRVHLLRTENKKKKLMKELTDALSYLKNVTILGRGENISAELMLEELADFSPGLSKTFLGMARSLSVNEKNVAEESLFETIGNDYARDIGVFLASWEDIPQTELLSSIEAYLNVLREEQITRQKEKDEMISDLVYFPVVINCMMVLLNFIYVSYFIEQESMLAQLFGL